MPFGIFAKKIEPIKTRFESSSEFKKINSIIVELRNEETVLKKCAKENGASSIDYKKHVIISHLLTRLEKLIGEFNNHPSGTNAEDEIIDQYSLALKMMLNTTLVLAPDAKKDTMLDNVILIDTPRNYSKKVIVNGTHMGLVAATIVATGPVGVLATMGVGLGSYVGFSLGENLVGFTTQTTSAKIVIKIINELTKLSENLSFAAKVSNPERLSSTHNGLISSELNEHPELKAFLDKEVPAFQLDSNDYKRLYYGK